MPLQRIKKLVRALGAIVTVTLGKLDAPEPDIVAAVKELKKALPLMHKILTITDEEGEL
jgi:hypothetical protein